MAKADGIDAKVTVLLATERALPTWLATIARALDVQWQVVKMPAAS